MTIQNPAGIVSRPNFVFYCVTILIAAFATASCGTRQEPTEARREVRQYTIEQFMKTVNISGASFSADEQSVLYTSDETGIPNVFSVPVAGGPARQVTASTQDSTYAVSYFPEDGRVLYSSDKGGNEITHLYVLATDGSSRDITPGDKAKAAFMGWSRDRQSFFAANNERDPRFMDIYRMSAADYSSKMIYKNDGGFFPAEVSGDEKYIVLVKLNTTNDSDIFVYNVAGGRTENITRHEGTVSNTPLSIDPRSRYLYFGTDEGSEFSYVKRYDFATGKSEEVLRKNWDVVAYAFSYNGKYRAVATNEDGQIRVQIYEDETGREIQLPDLPSGDITGLTFARSEQRLAFHLESDTSPGNLYVYDIAEGKTARLTDSLNPEIEPADLVDSRMVRFKSSDGLEIPGPLWVPQGAGAANRAPALVWVHGGPGGQTTKGYSAPIQYLVNHGYIVFGVNNRGSSGYGKSFLAADDQRHGREPLRDCVEAKDYLATLDIVDPARIGIIGGSYGGYMVLAALTLQPEAFAVGVDVFGVSNWLRTLQSIPPWWEAQRDALYQEMGDPNTQEEMLRAVSPLFHADQITKPLLVLQGANDPRVLKAESDEIVEAVRKKGGVVEYVVFDDEGHGFTKKNNQITAYEAIRKFLDTYLKGS